MEEKEKYDPYHVPDNVEEYARQYDECPCWNMLYVAKACLHYAKATDRPVNLSQIKYWSGEEFTGAIDEFGDTILENTTYISIMKYGKVVAEYRFNDLGRLKVVKKPKKPTEFILED